MLRRLWLVMLAFALPTVLVGCPDNDQSLGEEMEEAAEEIGDEVDDAM